MQRVAVGYVGLRFRGGAWRVQTIYMPRTPRPMLPPFTMNNWINNGTSLVMYVPSAQFPKPGQFANPRTLLESYLRARRSTPSILQQQAN